MGHLRLFCLGCLPFIIDFSLCYCSDELFQFDLQVILLLGAVPFIRNLQVSVKTALKLQRYMRIHM